MDRDHASDAGVGTFEFEGDKACLNGTVVLEQSGFGRRIDDFMREYASFVTVGDQRQDFGPHERTHTISQVEFAFTQQGIEVGVVRYRVGGTGHRTLKDKGHASNGGPVSSHGRE
jgi:hypothetical protein